MDRRLMQDFCLGLSELLSDSARLVEARDKIAQLEKDAARYRWLRNDPYWPEENMIRDPDELDEAIDAAIAQT